MRALLVVALLASPSVVVADTPSPAPVDPAPSPAPAPAPDPVEPTPMPAPATTPAPPLAPPSATPPQKPAADATPATASGEVRLAPRGPDGQFILPKPTQGWGSDEQRAKMSRTPAWVATGVTAGLLVAAGVAWWRYNDLSSENMTHGLRLEPIGSRERQQEYLDRAHRWQNISLGLAIGTLVSGSVTGYLWSRYDFAPRVSVDPANSAFSMGWYKNY